MATLASSRILLCTIEQTNKRAIITSNRSNSSIDSSIDRILPHTMEQTNTHHDVGTGNITGRKNSGKGRHGFYKIY